MELDFTLNHAEGYKSGSQIARRITEAWATQNLFCAECPSGTLAPTPPNTKAIDFICPTCNSPYQLKASKTWNERRIPDAGFNAMMSAIKSDRVPNLFVLQYAPVGRVINLLLIPSFFFAASSIQKRKPLSPKARRAGWVGCNILLSAIAPEGKIRIIKNGQIISSPRKVRVCVQRGKPVGTIIPKKRGWVLDVLNLVHAIERPDFTLQDVYKRESELKSLHPNNQNIRAKIRQQLQILRDLRLITFQGQGKYRIV